MYKLILLSMAVACHFFNSNLNASMLEDVMDREDKIDRFSALPAEIKAHIFSLCVPEQKISHRRVCKDWHDHLDQGLSAFFQQPKIKLDYCFYRDFCYIKQNFLKEKIVILPNLNDYFVRKSIFDVIASTITNLDFSYDEQSTDFLITQCFKKLEFLYIKSSKLILNLNIKSRRFPQLKKFKLNTICIMDNLVLNDDCFRNLSHLNLIFCVKHDWSSRCIDREFPNLKSSKLRFFQINHSTISSIGKLNKLKKLALIFRSIDDEIAIKISHTPLKKLKSLDLRENNIGSSGMQALINRFHHLSKLDLTRNRVSDQNLRQWLLRARWPHSWQSYHNRYFTAFAGAGLFLFVQPTNDGDLADSTAVLSDLDGLS